MAFLLHVLVLAAAMQGGTATTPHDKLSAFVGHWEGKGTYKDTAYSQASVVTSKEVCAWSAMGEYLICDQLLSLSTDQLTIFSHNKKEAAYSFCTLGNPGTAANCGAFNIEGTTWTFLNTLNNGKQKVTFRTTNIFDAPGHEKFKSEYSDDNGKTWKLMLEGEAHKVAGPAAKEPEKSAPRGKKKS
jgi:hypothetical protein